MIVQVKAQTFTVLHGFGKAGYTGTISTNSDGISPGQLLLLGNTLFGLTVAGTTHGNGTVFAINRDSNHPAAK